MTALGVTVAGATVRTVTIPRGQPLEIALVVDPAADFTPGVENAVRMAVQSSPPIPGHPVQIDEYNQPCTGDDSDVSTGLATAQSVLANPRTVAVIGHPCSFGFGGIPSSLAPGPCPAPIGPSALALYESAGLPTINGSTTNRCLPLVGPTVLNETAVPDPDFAAWYASVQKQLPDQIWRASYAHQFGSAAPDYADLYFDATRLLLNRIRQAARGPGNLSIDDVALGAAIRHTVNFAGVTCSVTLDPTTGARVEQPLSPLGRCIRGN